MDIRRSDQGMQVNDVCYAVIRLHSEKAMKFCHIYLSVAIRTSYPHSRMLMSGCISGYYLIDIMLQCSASQKANWTADLN